jgi:hypothetical protein
MLRPITKCYTAVEVTNHHKFWSYLESDPLKSLNPLASMSSLRIPTVGENLQDHGTIPLSYVGTDGTETLSNFQIPGIIAAETEDFLSNQNGLLTALITSTANLSYQQVDQRTGHVYAESIANLTEAAISDSPPALKKQYK